MEPPGNWVSRPCILYRFLYSSPMVTAGIEESLSITDASQRGISGLVADAERGSSVLVSRHGKPAAVVIGVERLESIFRREDDLRSATLVLTRAATDTGRRTSLDE